MNILSLKNFLDVDFLAGIWVESSVFAVLGYVNETIWHDLFDAGLSIGGLNLSLLFSGFSLLVLGDGLFNPSLWRELNLCIILDFMEVFWIESSIDSFLHNMHETISMNCWKCVMNALFLNHLLEIVIIPVVDSNVTDVKSRRVNRVSSSIKNLAVGKMIITVWHDLWSLGLRSEIFSIIIFVVEVGVISILHLKFGDV